MAQKIIQPEKGIYNYGTMNCYRIKMILGMVKFQKRFRIEPNRWQFWNYSDPGNYFITVCTTNRECFLGEIKDGKMNLSKYGEIIKSEIKKIPEYHKRALLNAWVVMPNHIHLIIGLGDYNYDNGISLYENNDPDDVTNTGFGNGINNCFVVEKIHEFSLPEPSSSPEQPPPPEPSWSHDSPDPLQFPWLQTHNPTLYEIKQYRKQRRNMLIPKFIGKFQMQTSKNINIIRNTPGYRNWQPSYHDHIIRDDKSYHRIKKYIEKNPENWTNDKFNKPR